MHKKKITLKNTNKSLGEHNNATTTTTTTTQQQQQQQ